MNTSNPAQTFLLEAEELLDQIEEIALEATRRPADTEAVNRLFRAFHTIKGSGAMFGFETVAAFTHHVESALDRVRTGAAAASPRLMELLLAARDRIKHLLEAGPGPNTSGPAENDDIIAALGDLMEHASAEPRPAANAAPRDEGGVMTKWRVRFRPPANLAASGLNPVALLDELRELGACTVRAQLDAVPPIDQLAAENCHVAWEIELTTNRGLNAIRDVFIFVEDGSELAIESIGAAPALAPKKTEQPAMTAAPTNTTGASGRPPVAVRKSVPKEASVRVPSVRLDQLVNLVGELVMNQSRLSQVAARVDSGELNAPVEELERLIAEVRDTVLGIRMMPIGTTFARFKRLVHDLSGELAKEIDLITEGAETELDKTVLDQLGDPLVHLIRNSIDHGVESPEVRETAGKPRRGTIRLAASHTGSNVVITIQDDGAGLDLDAIRAKAIEKKLIAAEANLTPREVYNLILLPGFSTAKQVTNVSGRGVGMDVVKRQIDALGGSLQIASECGRGTTISATLPITLAIIDGLLVEIAGDPFILPMAAVQENVELARADRTRQNGRNVIAVRGELVPYIYLRDTFEFGGEEPELEKVVIVRHGCDRVGLVVDRVLGSHQTVIQSLGRFYRDIGVLSGATIMGDGRVALILDVAGVVARVEQRNAAARAA